MSFTLELQKFAEKAMGNAHGAVRGITAEVHTRIDERSPVGDPTTWKNPAPKGYVGGRFRANWQLTADSIPSGVIDAIDPDGSATRGAVVASIPDEPAGRVLYLANNLPYAKRLEDGWSPQAPPGAMVGLTVMEIQQIADEVVAGLPQ
jgi:hypothetical protein